MSDRYWLWVAQRAELEQLRLGMALLGVFLVVCWAAVEWWPERWRQAGKAVMGIIGGVGYAVVLTMALATLGRDLGVVR